MCSLGNWGVIGPVNGFFFHREDMSSIYFPNRQRHPVFFNIQQ